MGASFDLHCHSNRSDGVLSPSQLVERAAARGVRVLALTDHDELSGLEEAQEAVRGRDMTLIPGVEISVTWAGRTVHVVGLRIDCASVELNTGLAAVRAGRRGRAERIAAGLAKAGVAEALAGARAYAVNSQLVGRTHFARFLVDRGYGRDIQAVFKRYLAAGQPGYVVHQWAALDDAVTWIRQAGGCAVLAHPGRYRLDGWERDALLSRFKALGGAAIEVVTGSHAPDQCVLWARAARDHGLHASLGSDFHGPGESYRDLGALPPLPAGCFPVWELF